MTVACFFQLCLRMFVPLLCSLLHFLSLSVCLFLSNNISIQSCSLIFCEKSVSIEQVEMVQFIYLSVSLSLSGCLWFPAVNVLSPFPFDQLKDKKKKHGQYLFYILFSFQINQTFLFLPVQQKATIKHFLRPLDARPHPHP